MKTRSDRDDDSVSAFPEVGYAAWRQRVEEELEGGDFRQRLVTELPSGLEVEPLYTARVPVDASRWATSHGRPGSAPFARGARATADRPGPGQLCQLFDEPEPARLDQALREDLHAGVGGVWLRLDRAGRLGGRPAAKDSDDGPPGARIQSLSDLGRALDGTSTDWRLWHLDAGANVLPAASLAAIWLERRPGDGEKVLLLGADPLAALAGDGQLPGPLDALVRDIAALVRCEHAVLRKARVLEVSTARYREAGAEVDQELGFALSTAIDYLRRLEREGVEPAVTACRMTFTFAVGQELFVEIAKLRAFRLLWYRVLEACGVDRPAPAWIHATTLRRSLSESDPWLNLPRITEACFAAVTGGADSVETASFDSARGGPHRRARRLARNTQHVLAHEAHLGQVADPGGGSYYIEWLTAELARVGWRRLREIEEAGGMVHALRSGWLRQRIDERWESRRRRVEHRIDPITAVSVNAEAAVPADVRPNGSDRPASEASGHRPSGGAGNRSPTLAEITPETDRVDWCLEAARCGATIREMTAILYPTGAAGREIERFPLRRDGEPFERLRRRAARLREAGGNPIVFLACLSSVAGVRSEVEFARDFFRAGGFEVVVGEAMGESFRGQLADSGARTVCLCGLSKHYRKDGAGMLAELRSADGLTIVAVGAPEGVSAWFADVVPDEHIFAGCHATEILADLLARESAAMGLSVP